MLPAKGISKFIPAVPAKGQKEYYKALQEKEIVFVSGSAGSGKSFLALNQAIRHIADPRDKITKISIVRPYIFTSAEKLGALPGTLDEKILPFVAAIKDNLEELLQSKQEIDFVLSKIEFLTLSTLRGRSLHNRFILVEEAQNTPIEGDGMLTILTRMGKNSKMVIAGDPSQCDLPIDDTGFMEAANALSGLEEVSYVEMNDLSSIHRNKIIGKIIKAFQDYRQTRQD